LLKHRVQIHPIANAGEHIVQAHAPAFHRFERSPVRWNASLIAETALAPKHLGRILHVRHR
jgi:hypothetical protein